MDFYIGCLVAVWLAAGTATVWVYKIKTRDADALLGFTEAQVERLQTEKDKAEKKYQLKDQELRLLAVQKMASAEVELQRVAKPKVCKAKQKKKLHHKRSREWD